MVLRQQGGSITSGCWHYMAGGFHYYHFSAAYYSLISTAVVAASLRASEELLQGWRCYLGGMTVIEVVQVAANIEKKDK